MDGVNRMYLWTATITGILTASGAGLFATDDAAAGQALASLREVLAARDDLSANATVNVAIATLSDDQVAALLAQVSLLRPDLLDRAALIQLELDATTEGAEG